ncbi:RICIN domain-containing protein [Streptomyces yangpuensis]|uniref:RICIN domain-containing protein n=1 Tax=Streptomyces yangpuensis TaxID=1648182 RepID=UPI003646D862
MRNRLLVIFALVASLFGLGLVNTSNASALGAPGEWVFFSNSYYLGLPNCATPEGNRTANGTVLTQWTCKEHEIQRFAYDSSGRIVHKVSGKCVTPQGDNSFTNGVVLTLWTCGTSYSQQFVTTWDKTFTQDGGKCVTPKGDSFANGVWLTLWTCASPSAPSQRWT